MKGSVTDLPVIIIMLIVGAVSIFIIYMVLGAVSAAWTANLPTDIAGIAESQGVLDKGLAALQVFDYMFLVYAFGLGAVVIASGFFIDSHPALFALSALFYLPCVIVVAAQMSNVFYELANTETFLAVSETFPMITYFMMNLPLFILIIGALIAVAVHAKEGGGTSL